MYVPSKPQLAMVSRAVCHDRNRSLPEKAVNAVALNVVTSSAAFAIRAHRPRNAPSNKYYVPKKLQIMIVSAATEIQAPRVVHTIFKVRG